jgi:uncharacterized protein HemY
MNSLEHKTQRLIVAAGAAFFLVATQSCAPRPPYRTPVPSGSRAPSSPKAPEPPPPSAPAQETVRRPLPQDSKIKEQDLKTNRGSTIPPAGKEPSKEGSIGETRKPSEAVAPLPDDSSLLAKITSGTSPQRAASLRLTEEGRRLLDAGDARKALNRLEQTIVIDSTNPYGYFFLAKAHYRLGRYKESLNFLDVAESRLSQETFWLAEVYALRGENFRSLGMTQKAEASYTQALRLNSGNRTAAEALSNPH